MRTIALILREKQSLYCQGNTKDLPLPILCIPVQSLESGQHFDYLFKCAGLKLIASWDLKEHHIIIIIIKNHQGKISIEFSE